MTNSGVTNNQKTTSNSYQKKEWASAYKNVENELANVELKLSKGKVPKELFGTLYRNGPGQLERGGKWVHHPFDGDGMITAISFNNSKVIFSNKFVRTKAWKEEQEAGEFIYRGVFGTQKKGGAIKNAFDLRLKNIANTNVIKLGDELLALWEAASPYSLDPENLETKGLSNLRGILRDGEAFSAHPRFDPGHHNSPRMVTFGVNTGPKSTIRLMEFATQGKKGGTLISDRKDTFNGFAFLHDFAITPNWSIFLQNAIDFNPIPFIFGFRGAAQCLKSKPNELSKFWLIPRDSGRFSGEQPRIFDAPIGFVFHHINAWELGKKIFVESIYYDDFPTINPNEDFREINFNSIPEGRLKRCEINLDEGIVKVEELSKQCCEFGMVNPDRQGLHAKYAWMATATQEEGNGPLQMIKKLDLTNGTKCFWNSGQHCFVNEPTMIPNPNTSDEDDGWVFVIIWDGQREVNELAILKAKDLELEAKLELPIKIPYGLHGNWVRS